MDKTAEVAESAWLESWLRALEIPSLRRATLRQVYRVTHEANVFFHDIHGGYTMESGETTFATVTFGSRAAWAEINRRKAMSVYRRWPHWLWRQVAWLAVHNGWRQAPGLWWGDAKYQSRQFRRWRYQKREALRIWIQYGGWKRSLLRLHQRLLYGPKKVLFC